MEKKNLEATLRYILFLLFFLTSFVISVFVFSLLGIYSDIRGVIAFLVSLVASYFLVRNKMNDIWNKI